MEVLEPLPGLPDMVFAANGATVVDGRVLGAKFANPERTAEAPAHLAWFRAGLWGPMAHSIDQAEWIIAYSRQTYPCPVPAGATRVFTVEADGATLAEVWRR